MNKIIINGTGCYVGDLLFNDINFYSDRLKPYWSKNPGDGGLKTGKLVIGDSFEMFCGKKINNFLIDALGSNKPDIFNLGGPCAAGLIHCAQMLSHINTEINFYGAFGNDKETQILLEMFKKTPVNISKSTKFECESPKTIVLSDPDYCQGERLFIHSIGANKRLLPENLDNDFFKADIAFFSGTAIVPGIHANITGLLKEAKQAGCITIVGTVYDFISEEHNPGKPWPMGNGTDSYPLIDLLIADREEAGRLTNKTDIGDIINTFQSYGLKAAIITHGANPLHLYSNGGIFTELEATSLPVSEEIVRELLNPASIQKDTTGCGDNFAGGVLASIAEQKLRMKKNIDIIETCCLGVVSGGYACFYSGGTYFEKKQGEKRQHISNYYELYKKQIKNIRHIKRGC